MLQRPLASTLPFRVLIGGLVVFALAGCSSLSKDADPSAASTVPTPQASPSIWLSGGSAAAVTQASADLIRRTDLPSGYTSSALQLSSSKGVRPKACAAILGPAVALINGSTGHAATSFISSSTAIAHTVGVFTSATSAQDVLDKAVRLGSACRSITAQNTRLTVKVTRTTVRGIEAVVLTEKQKAGAEQITIMTQGNVTTVVAVAALPPGPASDLLSTVTGAASQRLGRVG